MKTLIKCVNELIKYNNSVHEGTSYSVYKDELSLIIKKSKNNMIDDNITPKELGTILITMNEIIPTQFIQTLAMLRQMELSESEIEPMVVKAPEDKYVLEILDRIANLIDAIDECCRETIMLMAMINDCIIKEFQFD
jgi:hypothetical protein